MKKNVVFIVNFQESDRGGPYQYSVNSWKNWCKKNDFTFFVLSERIHEKETMNPNWHKLFVFDVLEKNKIDYDQILVADADTIVHPNCPNFFALSNNRLCGVHNEGSYDWVFRSMENYSKFIFKGFTFPFWRYINSGFLILNDSHKSFYKEIVNFYLNNAGEIKKMQETFQVGTDQPIINFFLNIHKIDYNILPYEFNMQDMSRKEILDEELTFTKLGWVYHFNAIPNNQSSDKSLYWMKKTYNTLYKEKQI